MAECTASREIKSGERRKGADQAEYSAPGGRTCFIARSVAGTDSRRAGLKSFDKIPQTERVQSSVRGVDQDKAVLFKAAEYVNLVQAAWGLE
jgi:hypothetical protein